MSKEFSRNRRIAEQMRRNLSEIVRRELKDPRLQFLTITRVDLSGDLSHAKVFFSLLQPDADPGPAAAALDRAAGFVRSQLGRSMHIRQIPELHFIHDTSLAEGARITSLVEEAVEQDRRRHTDDE
ncbi:MAG: ribosome-binding factor A [Gammaproteobacteria bacterium SG8_31]|jgi:ribosome-binding factor A|nr:MAG: ribosome-binding factor A [Gammaproteobacteria bacterium SG8_31]